jgi:antitoxin HicB
MYYEIKIELDETEAETCIWLVTVPSFPEITTFGENKEEAATAALGAIQEAMAARIFDNEVFDAPIKDTNGIGYYVEVPALVRLKAALFHICLDKGVSRAELGRRLKWHREQVDRLFRLDHNSRIDQLELAFKALGVQLSFETETLAAA